MSGSDKEIGRTIAELRGDKTQQAVSVEMRNRGWKWSQATVWSIEKGERPLRLREASDLAEVLGTSMDRFFSDSNSVRLEDDLRETVLRHDRDYENLVSNIENYLLDQDHLESLIRHPRIQGNADVAYWRKLAEESVSHSPSTAVKKGYARYKMTVEGEDKAMEIIAEYGGFDAYYEAIGGRDVDPEKA